MKFLLLALLAADPRVVEVFKDKGDTFIRAGTNAGLKVGAEVTILGDKIGGIGPAKRITLYNGGETGWANCEVRLPNNKRYKLGALKGRDYEGIMITRFNQEGTELDRPLDGVVVKCDQGSAHFNFSM